MTSKLLGLWLPSLAAATLIFGASGAAAQSANLAGTTGYPAIVAAPDAFVSACSRYPWLCEASNRRADAPTGDAFLDLIRDVNRRVNSKVAPLTDAENYGTAEYWTLPKNGYGDCEDYVMEKYRRLLDAGIGSEDMRIAIVLDRNGDNHVVLVVRYEGIDLVLDNLRRKIRPWNRTGYTYLAVQIDGDRQQWEVVAGRPKSSELLAVR